jgi:hypothetical protein
MSSKEFNQSLFKDIFGDLEPEEQIKMVKIINGINAVLERAKYDNRF